MTASKDEIVLINNPHLKFRLVNYLGISQPLKQLLNVSVLCHSQEYLFGKFACKLLSKHLYRILFSRKFHAFSIFL